VLALPAPLQPLAPVVDRVGGPRRALILLVGLVTAVLVLGVSRWATRPAWVPGFVNVPVEHSGKLTDKLTEAGIEFRLDKGGTEVAVKTDDLARARVVVARDGTLPNAGRPGLELFDQPSWGMTDFTQRVNYRRALEGELERTIGKMRGVELAQVHLAMSESPLFRRQDRPMEASVVLRLTNGERPPADVVRGIAHLVSASVDGLASNQVTVVDDAGRLLTMEGDGSGAELTSKQLEVQRDVEERLERKAQQIVAEVVGTRNARVQVSADINFDKVDRTVEAVDPDKQAVATEQRAEITPGAQGGAASTNVATSYETTKSTETVSGAIGKLRRLSVAVLVNDRMTTGPSPKPVPRTPVELAQLDTLVRNAVGADTARGDRVNVVNVRFDGLAAPAAEEAPDVWARVSQAEKPIIAGAALAALLVVAFLTTRALRRTDAADAAAAPALLAAGTPAGDADPADADDATDPVAALAAAAAAATPGALAAGEARPALPAAAPPVETALPPQIANPVRDQVIAIIDQRPEAAARVVRAWLRQD
jgi:flagellar M-ring protein FliF